MMHRTEMKIKLNNIVSLLQQILFIFISLWMLACTVPLKYLAEVVWPQWKQSSQEIVIYFTGQRTIISSLWFWYRFCNFFPGCFILISMDLSSTVTQAKGTRVKFKDPCRWLSRADTGAAEILDEAGL